MKGVIALFVCVFLAAGPVLAFPYSSYPWSPAPKYPQHSARPGPRMPISSPGIAGFANPLCAYCMSIRPCCCQRICAGRFAGGFGGIRSSIGLPISSGGAFGSSIGLPMSSTGGFGSSIGLPMSSTGGIGSSIGFPLSSRGFGGGFSRPLYPGFPFSRSAGSFSFHRGRGAGFGSGGSGGLSGSFQGGGGSINSFGYDHDHDD
uniref:Glycine-rich protein 5-like n=1 Tax=Crassostrea virginica TaxID=6565 RepID=A0A8B8DJ64_CRAVI|nr:glycine-rich protein 5-like [Crassostrea virginica]